MQIICGGCAIELEAVVDQYQTMLYRLAMVRMGNREDAEEMVQDTFLRLMQQIKKGKKFTDEEHLKAWLLTVAANRGKSIVTQAWNKRTQGFGDAPEMAAEEKSDGDAFSYVMMLPEKYKVAIQLFYYEEMTTEQIAKIMKTQPATVRSYLHRGREKLKVMMEKDAYVG